MQSAMLCERVLFAVPREGEGFETTFRIGQPKPASDVSWTCAVSAEGLLRPADIHGIDAWQALILALSLLESQVAHFLENGGALFFERGGLKMTREDLFPRSWMHGEDA
jgi:hypothetical protein